MHTLSMIVSSSMVMCPCFKSVNTVIKSYYHHKETNKCYIRGSISLLIFQEKKTNYCIFFYYWNYTTLECHKIVQ